MRKIVITGANGFIGKNLKAHLAQVPNIEVESIVATDLPESYEAKLRGAEIVYHLAGINRPKSEAAFAEVNIGFTEHILGIIARLGKCPLLIFSSSTQADKDNPYGKSKHTAELSIKKAAEKRHITAAIYRLPGVFGKWCKPHYNSVVATFCHNIANNLPIEIRDPHYTFPLVYIDDVVSQFLSHLNDSGTDDWKYHTIRTVFQTSLGDLASIINTFPESRKTLKTPKVGDAFTKCLYSTYLSYLPTDAFSYSMELKADNRGDLFEWIKSEAFGQIFISTTKPGVTRGNHYHHTKTEKFLVIRGEASICFRKIDCEEVIEYKVRGNHPTVVDIPPGYTHNITNTGDNELITLFWANEIFNPAQMDTYFVEV